jgi:uncharacterized protein YgiM (DUF1202 family)
VNNFQYIGATLTGVAAIATASVSIYTTFHTKEKKQLSHIRVGLIYDIDGWTNLRQLPSTESKILTRLANNTEVAIINDSGNWFQIQTMNNTVGFIHKQNILEK